jgi:hypothetical protein
MTILFNSLEINSQRYTETTNLQRWLATVKTKANLFKAIAHFHALSVMPPDRIVAERIARLTLARSFILESIKTSSSDPVLHTVSCGYRDVISNNLQLAQDENWTRHHQGECDVRMLGPLKYPGQDLLRCENGETILGDAGRFSDIFGEIMSPTHRGEMVAFVCEAEGSLEGQIGELMGLSRKCGDAIYPGVGEIKIREEESEDERLGLHKKSIGLMEQIRACKKEESVLENEDLAKSIVALYSILGKMLGEIRSHLKRRNSDTPLEDKELHRAATKINRELDQCKEDLNLLDKGLNQIRERGILDWSEVKHRDINHRMK